MKARKKKRGGKKYQRKSRHALGKRDVALAGSAAPVPVPVGDHGADGVANRARMILCPVEGDPNGTHRARRLTQAQIYLMLGLLDIRQATVAHKLLLAWEQKDRLTDRTAVKVDASPKPDDATVMHLERMDNYVAISRHVPEAYAAEIYRVARDDLPVQPRLLGRLRKGLNLMADSKGM